MAGYGNHFEPLGGEVGALHVAGAGATVGANVQNASIKNSLPKGNFD